MVAKKGGSMASDITLAVGDGARRMTYAELAAVRGISALSAERLARRKRWPRQVSNDGVVRILVPLTEARKVSGNRRVLSTGYASRTSAPDIRGIIKEVIREIAGAAPRMTGRISARCNVSSTSATAQLQRTKKRFAICVVCSPTSGAG
jgi:hypothetical protein